MKNRVYSILLASIIVSGILAGCIGDTTPATEDETNPDNGEQGNQTQNQTADNGTIDENNTGENNGTTDNFVDSDGDGSSDDIDCEILDPEIHPNATEIWNGVDDNCDDIIDPYISRHGNASFKMQWESIGWVIDDSQNLMGHTLYWMGDGYFAYRFLASPDQVFEFGSASTIHNFSNASNVNATLATLNLSASNISISMTEMNLGMDVEGLDWEFDNQTYIETRYYSGGEFIFALDGEEFMSVEVGFTEFLNYGEHYDENITDPSVKIYGHSNFGNLSIIADEDTQPNLWRLANSFTVDFNDQIQFGFISQDAVIKEHYDEQQASAIELGVVANITELLSCDSEGDSCPNWIAAEFNQLVSIVISSED